MAGEVKDFSSGFLAFFGQLVEKNSEVLEFECIECGGDYRAKTPDEMYVCPLCGKFQNYAGRTDSDNDSWKTPPRVYTDPELPAIPIVEAVTSDENNGIVIIEAECLHCGYVYAPQNIVEVVICPKCGKV